ncbi:DUF2281 domain-containing protein [Lacihabitans sp. CCS-44]|uniref:DUF2281 domain-containing protein n=1 Tax=Lacihabitans sp. CCS-44 TaxID=2487331 RepID=UPI0020CF212F|nr:DUF2281 domain-containing protein [Lacihabitans sp. CCS-44]MCP9754431.1 DUF2281 domain-containing protein [Lacihabitans sp. CCS-44]
MTKKAIIDKTLEVIHKLPEDKINEVSDFADFLFKKYEDKLILDNISAIVGKSESFNFLNEDENLYSSKDLKLVFNEKG